MCTFAAYPREKNDISVLEQYAKRLFDEFGAVCEIIPIEIAGVDDDVLTISSSKIIELLKNRENVAKYLDEKVYDYIIAPLLYKSCSED